MALRTKSHEEIVAENTFDGMQDIIQPEDEVPEGYESIEEVTDGVDLEDLIKEDEEEEESSESSEEEDVWEKSSDIDENEDDDDEEESFESSEEEDVWEKSSDIDENEDDDDDFWNLLDAVEDDDEDYDEEESSTNLVMVNSVYESLADKVNQITELMSDMASTEHESGVYASDVMVDRMCDHIQKALDNLRPCLKKKLVEEFKW